MGYTFFVGYSSFSEECLELGEDVVFQVHANDFPEITHWAFSGIIVQLPSSLELTHRFCSTPRFAILLTLHRMPEITGWTY